MSNNFNNIFQTIFSIIPVVMLSGIIPAIISVGGGVQTQYATARPSMVAYMKGVVRQFAQTISVEDIELVGRATDILASKIFEAYDKGEAVLSESEYKTLMEASRSMDKIIAFLAALKDKLEHPHYRVVRTKYDTLVVKYMRRLSRVLDKSINVLRKLKESVAKIVADRRITREEAKSLFKNLAPSILKSIAAPVRDIVVVISEVLR